VTHQDQDSLQRGEWSLEALIGGEAVMTKTITAADLAGFAEITGDDHPNHTDQDYALARGFGGCVAQGSLLVGLIAGASCRFLEKVKRAAVSYGYDNVRFLRPVQIGDQVTITYRIRGCDTAKSNVFAECELVNQHGHLVAVGRNTLHFST